MVGQISSQGPEGMVEPSQSTVDQDAERVCVTRSRLREQPLQRQTPSSLAPAASSHLLMVLQPPQTSPQPRKEELRRRGDQLRFKQQHSLPTSLLVLCHRQSAVYGALVA